jgi:hypothetical protein
VTLTNNGGHAGAADLYAWGIHDAKDTTIGELDIRDVGLQQLPGSVLGGSPSDTSLVFAINGYGRVANAAQNEFDIAIDTKGSPAPEFFVVGVDAGVVLTGSFNGVLASFVFDATGKLVGSPLLAEAPLNGSTVLLPVLASELGLGPDAKDFQYGVTGFSIVPGDGVQDATATAKYDLRKPPVSSGGFVPLARGESASVPLSGDTGKLQSTKTLGWLAVDLDDASGAAQADEIPIGSAR